MDRGYEKIVRTLLEKIEGIPEILVVAYLRKAHNLTENTAHQTVYAAVRNRAAYKKDGWLLRTPYIEVNSALRNKAKAFRVVLEFLPDSMNFVCSQYPWLITFSRGQFLVQVCKIDADMELTTSMMIAATPVDKHDKPYIKRIAIVEPSCNFEKVKKVGFSNFCVVDDDFVMEVINNIPPEKAWEDNDA